jgi:hypothetical protein
LAVLEYWLQEEMVSVPTMLLAMVRPIVISSYKGLYVC